MISSIASLVYEFSYELPNDLRLRVLGNKEILGKSQIWVELCPNALTPLQKLNLSKRVKKHAKVDIKLSYPVQFHYTSLPCSKHPTRDCRPQPPCRAICPQEVTSTAHENFWNIVVIYDNKDFLNSFWANLVERHQN